MGTFVDIENPSSALAVEDKTKHKAKRMMIRFRMYFFIVFSPYYSVRFKVDPVY